MPFKRGALYASRFIMSRLSDELGHLKNHVKYPASRSEVVATCNNMSDVAEEDRKWFSNNLPDRRYSKAEDVLTALLSKV